MPETEQQLTPIDRALRLTDFRKPLAGDELRALYVARGDKIAEEIVAQLQASDSAKLILTGPPGSGKSTELRRVGELLRHIKPPLTCQMPSPDEFLDLTTLDWAGLLVLLAEGPLLAGELADVPMPDQAAAWIRLVVAPGAPELPKTYAEGRRLSRAFRRGSVEQRLDFAERIRNSPRLAIEALRQLLRPLEPSVFLIDGLEKLALEAARRLFHEQGTHLRDLPGRYVFVAPIDLVYEDFSGTTLPEYFSVHRIPPIPLRDPQGEIVPEEIDRILDIGRRRLAAASLSTELPESLALKSGGLVRQFLFMLYQALLVAKLEQLSSLNGYCFDRAESKQRETFAYQIAQEDRDRLRLFLQGNEPGREKLRDYVRRNFVLEYRTPAGRVYRRLNPLVEDLLH